MAIVVSKGKGGPRWSVRGNIDKKLWSVGFGCDAYRPVRDQISSQNLCALTTVLGNVCLDEQSNHHQRRRRGLASLQGQSTAILGRAPRGSRQVSTATRDEVNEGAC